MRYHKLEPQQTVKVFDGYVKFFTKSLYAKVVSSKFGQPSPLSRMLRDRGSFGGHSEQLPDVPPDYRSLDELLYLSLLKSKKKNGFFGRMHSISTTKRITRMLRVRRIEAC